MNYLRKLFEMYYENGFINGDHDDKFRCIRMMQLLLKENNINYDLMPYFNNQNGEYLKANDTNTLRALENYDNFNDMMKIVYDSKLKIEEKNPTDKYINAYEGVCLRNNMIKNRGELLHEIKEKEEVLPNLEKNERVVKLNEFKTKLKLHFDNSIKENPIGQKEMHNQAIGKELYNGIMESFIYNLFSKSNNEFSLLASFAIDNDDNKKEFKNFFRKIINYQLNDDEALKNKTNEIFDSNISLSDGLKELDTYMNSRNDKANLLARLDNATFNVLLNKVIGNINQTDKFDYIFNKLEDIDGIEKNIPSDDKFKTVFDDLENADEHSKSMQIRKLISELNVGDDFINDLKYANDIIVNGTDESVATSFQIAEDIGKEYDRQLNELSMNRLKESGIENFVLKEGVLSYSGKREDFAKVINDSFELDISLNEDYKNKIINLANEMKDAGLYDKKFYQPEEDKKYYAFNALKNKKKEMLDEINKSFDADWKRKDYNIDKENFKRLTNEYKELDNFYTKIMKEANEIENTGVISQNISSTRADEVPAKYRLDYVGNSRINAIYHMLAFCEQNNSTIEEVLDNPTAAAYKGIVNSYENNKMNTLLKNDSLNIFQKLDYYKKNRAEFEKEMGTAVKLNTSAITRAIGAVLYLTDEENRIDLQAALKPLDTYVNSDLNAQVTMLYRSFDSNNKAQTMANMLILKKENLDYNPTNISAAITEGIDPFTLEVINKPTLAEYIDKTYSISELTNKIKEIRTLINDNKDKPEYDRDILNSVTLIKDAINQSKIYTDVAKEELVSLFDKDSVYLDSLVNNTKNYNEVNADSNFKEFYRSSNELLEQYLLINNTNDVGENFINKIDSYYSIKRLESYRVQFEKSLNESNCNLRLINTSLKNAGNDLRYEVDTIPGMFKVMDAIFKEDPLFKPFKMKKEVVDTIELSSMKDQLTHPEEYEKFLEKNPNLDPNLVEKYNNVFTGHANDIGFMQTLENKIQDDTAIEIMKKPVLEFMKENDDLADSFTVADHSTIARFNPKNNIEITKECVKLIDDFDISSKTKSNIMKVYNKMKDYEMMIDFPDVSEEAYKIYGFHKYVNAYKAFENALQSNNLAEVERLSNEYPKLMYEYTDVLDTCKEVFMQDGLHVTGNVYAGRHGFYPLEFSSRVQEQIQMSAIYCLAGECHRNGIDFEWAVNNPSEFAKKLLEENNNYLNKALVGKKPGDTFVNIAEGFVPFTTGTQRAIECLISLESDEKLREDGGVIYTIMDGISAANGVLSNPFEIMSGGRHIGYDYNSMKMFLADFNTDNPKKYLANSIDVTTGGHFVNDDNYEELIDNYKDRDIIEVLNETVGNLSKTILEANDRHSTSELYNHLLVSASLLIKDICNAKNIVPNNSATYLKLEEFMLNPAGVVKRNLLANYKEEIDEYNEFVFFENIDNLLDQFDLYDEQAMRFKEYGDLINTYNTDALINEFNALKSLGENDIKANNFAKMIILGKKLNEKSLNYGLLSRTFGGEYKKINQALDFIKDNISKAVSPEFYESAVVLGDDNLINISKLENKYKTQDKINSLNEENTINEFNKIFNTNDLTKLNNVEIQVVEKVKNLPDGENGLTDDEKTTYKNALKLLNIMDELNVNNLTGCMKLYNEINLVKQSDITNNQKTMLDNSLKALTKKMDSIGFVQGFRDLYNGDNTRTEEIIDSINQVKKEREESSRKKVTVNVENGKIIVPKNKEIKKQVIKENANNKSKEQAVKENVVNNQNEIKMDEINTNSINNNIINNDINNDFDPADFQKKYGQTKEERDAMYDDVEKIELNDGKDDVISPIIGK